MLIDEVVDLEPGASQVIVLSTKAIGLVLDVVDGKIQVQTFGSTLWYLPEALKYYGTPGVDTPHDDDYE